jgi:hypothetical protein
VTRARTRVPGLTDPDEGARVATDDGAAALPPLPHERDEHAGEEALPTRPMRLAAEDVAEGRVDTDCRGSTPAAECELPALLKPSPPSHRKGAA